ncbi:hypothetical protein HZC21_03575 [Candidatus Peregrinibacteria bacterium]|nr:hypothetical protein [Candidatus Peregrinibacteria bacterium]
MLNQNNGKFFKKILVSLGVMLAIAAVSSVFVFYKLDSKTFKTEIPSSVPSGLPSFMLSGISVQIQETFQTRKGILNTLEKLNFSIPKLKANFADAEKAINDMQTALVAGDSELIIKHMNTVISKVSMDAYLKTEEGMATFSKLNADAKKVGETIELAKKWLSLYDGSDKNQLEDIYSGVSEEYKVIKANLAKESLTDTIDSLRILIDGLVKLLPPLAPTDLNGAEMNSAVEKFNFIYSYGAGLDFDVSKLKTKLDALKGKQASSSANVIPSGGAANQSGVVSSSSSAVEVKFNDVPGKGKKKLNKQTAGFIKEIIEKMILAKIYELPADKLFKPNNITSDGFAARIALAVQGTKFCGKQITDKTCKLAAAKAGILDLEKLPSKKITRAEFYEMLIKAGNIPLADAAEIKPANLCKDVKVSDKYASVIATAKTYNIADIYKGGKCNAGKPFPRYQAASFAMRTLKAMELLK